MHSLIHKYIYIVNLWGGYHFVGTLDRVGVEKGGIEGEVRAFGCNRSKTENYILPLLYSTLLFLSLYPAILFHCLSFLNFFHPISAHTTWLYHSCPQALLCTLQTEYSIGIKYSYAHQPVQFNSLSTCRLMCHLCWLIVDCIYRTFGITKNIFYFSQQRGENFIILSTILNFHAYFSWERTNEKFGIFNMFLFTS